jgi:TonB family protein
VVTGQGLKSDRDESETSVIKLAEPFGGKKAYDKYLENNLRYPHQALENKVKGKVTINFMVGTDGTLRDFSVMKSLGYGCDDEVIRLVKDGPKWYPSTEDNVAIESTVRVKMKFNPEKVKK